MTTDLVGRLADELTNGFSDHFLAVLRFYGQLHKYSLNNALLLHLQRPDGTAFASYATWKRLGRQVKGGARACWVWCPVFERERDERTGEDVQRLVGFRPGPVHPAEDLIDIEENPLPDIHPDLPDDHQELFQLFAAHLRVEGIEVQTEKLRLGLAGYARAGHTIVISTRLRSRHRIAVLLHEAAHVWLHQRNVPVEERVPAQQAEAEAEAVAYVVLDMIGLTGAVTADYLKHWQVTPDQLTASLERIQRGVRTLVRVLCLAPPNEMSGGQQT